MKKFLLALLLLPAALQAAPEVSGSTLRINGNGTVGGTLTVSNINMSGTMAAGTITATTLNPTAIAPASDDGAALGNATHAFSDLFLASGAVIDWNNGDTTLTHSSKVLSLSGGTTAAEFRFLEPSGSGTNYSAFKAVAQTANITYFLPPTVGAAGTVLTDAAGNGVLTWAAGGSANALTAASAASAADHVWVSGAASRAVVESPLTVNPGTGDIGGIGSLYGSDGTKRLNQSLTVYAAGTAYSLTATAAALDFGTTDPTLVIDSPGTYLIFGRALLKYNGATYAGTQTATLKLRRTNNTAADIANATTTATMRIVTTITDTVGVMPLPPVIYTTSASDDSISVFGVLSATPAAGSVDATEASIVCIRLYQ